MTVTSAPRPTDARPRPTATRTRARRIEEVIDSIASWLAAHSVTALRISLGLIILGFGMLKYFPGRLTSGAAGHAYGRHPDLRAGLGYPGGRRHRRGGDPHRPHPGHRNRPAGRPRDAGRALLGWMSPLLLFPGDLFPGGLPTLEAQYVFKDLVLGAAGAVVAARVPGARYFRDR
jgi:putative oxidoreductase